MTKFLLAHDIGTAGNKATLFITDGDLLKSVSGTESTGLVASRLQKYK
jgi:hypothetical protein